MGCFLQVKNSANDTIDDYDLNDVDNISQLSYRLAKIYIKPNERKMAWQNNVFYNDNGNALWSKETPEYSLRWQNIYPNSANERTYTFIIDQVYHNGQTIDFDMWKTGNNRWERLYQSDNDDGTVSYDCFDKLSLRINGNIITYWTYTQKRQDDVILDENYYKEMLDIKDKKYEILGIRVKDTNGDWNFRNSYDSKWTSIIPGTKGDGDAEIILKYVNQNKIDNID